MIIALVCVLLECYKKDHHKKQEAYPKEYRATVVTINNLSIVPSDKQSPHSTTVILYYLHMRHEPCNVHIVWHLLKEQKQIATFKTALTYSWHEVFSRDFHIGSGQGKVAQESAFLLKQERSELKGGKRSSAILNENIQLVIYFCKDLVFISSILIHFFNLPIRECSLEAPGELHKKNIHTNFNTYLCMHVGCILATNLKSKSLAN